MMGFTLKILLRGEVLLLLATALALLLANSAAAPAYFVALEWHGPANIALPLSLHHFINDGLMAIFFLQVGLEIKRELLDGALDSWPKRSLPALAALGGMIVPALIFTAFNRGHAEAMRGWAIPTATDIAFALGVLAAIENRVPASLKIFLTALAILDDLGAIFIIALFYAGALQGLYLGGAALLLAALWFINRKTTSSLPLLIGFVLVWFCFYKSGIHATLAGVAVALTVPLERLEKYEHALAPIVAYAIVPLFALANAGVTLANVPLEAAFGPVSLGVAFGLFLGKQGGVFAFAVTAIKLKLATMPEGANLRQLYGIAVLCGIGFTMSLFISSLGFAALPMLDESAKLAVLAGSALSALVGLAVLAKRSN